MSIPTREYVLACDFSMKIGTFVWLIGKIEKLSLERKKLHLRTSDKAVIFAILKEPYTGPEEGYVEVGGTVTGTKTVQCEQLLWPTQESSVLRDRFEFLRVRAPSTSQEPLSNQEHLRRSRATEPEETTLHRRQAELQRQNAARQQESEEAALLRRQNNAERQCNARLKDSDEEIRRRQQSDAERKRRERAELSGEEAAERCAIEAASKKKQRAQQKSNKKAETRYSALSYSETEPTLHYLKEMDKTCTACGARHFEGEITQGDKNLFTTCCQKGAVVLEPIATERFPAMLRSLLLGDHRDSNRFFAHIRKYNSALAFASVVARLDNLGGHGPYTYRISGQLYHFLGPAHPSNDHGGRYGQLYFLDSSDATEIRITDPVNANLLPSLLADLEETIRSCSPYAAAFRMMREVEDEENCKARMDQRPPLEVRLIFDNDQRNPQRRFRAPTTNEVAAVIVGNATGDFPEHSLAVHSKSSGLRTIPSLNGDCDPMCYPLFFPYGIKGFHPQLKRENAGRRNNVSQLEYYAYRTAERGEFNPILHGRALFQQYVVDAYIKVEESRLQYQRQNQKRLRVESYQGLSDYVATAASQRGVQPGRVVILSSSFTCGPRAMRQNYQDAMSLCRKFGKPYVFLTKTLNPKCKEITENLYPGQKATDRPDLVARVFKLKLKDLMRDIVENEIFGRVEGFCYTIEFQKRGLPHCHLLLILDKRDAKVEADNIDQIVSCEIPDSALYPRLHEAVKNLMVHGPCGDLNPQCVCMRETGTCHAKFPKSFCPVTSPNKDGYPEYMRRNNNVTIAIGSREVDNRWIVPYNPYLLLKYNCHINVEICATVKSFKYLYKYIFKGNDVSLMSAVSSDGEQVLNLDEIASFVESRYISAPEAVWRLNKYDMQELPHSIVRLPVHKPEEQAVYFEAGQEEEALEAATTRDTMLTAWFKLNAANSEARSILYHDVPVSYRFEKAVWKRRVHGDNTKVIGRMYTVNPRDYERFFLRLLLLHVAGATSFADLRTVNGQICQTFEEAASMRGLIENNDQWVQCMQEAAFTAMPAAIRSLFVTILIYGHLPPREAQQLWEMFHAVMLEDFQRQHSPELSLYLAYADINKRLDSFGASLLQPYGIPEPPKPAVIEEDLIDRKAELDKGSTMIASMNEAQQTVAEAVLSSARGSCSQKCFFVDAPGGTGKTFVFTALAHQLTGEGFNVLCIASTGIAGNLLPRGTTVHTGLGLPLKLDERSRLSVSNRSSLALKLRSADVILWDEAPMSPASALECVDVSFRELMQNSIPFGGKVMVLGGDYRQVLPVVQHESKAQQIACCLKRSVLWRLFKTYHLNQNVRATAGQTDFCEGLLRLGEGTLDCDENSEIAVPECCISLGDIVTEIFGDTIDISDTEGLLKSVILCPTNEETLDINDTIVEKLPGEAATYTSVDTVVCDDGEDPTEFPEEFLYTLTPSGLPPHKLTLKVGTVVMLLRNLDAKHGLCNGTRMIVRQLRNYSLDCEVLSGSSKGKRVLIPRIKLQPTGDFLPFNFSRLQFPVRIAFAMTINKAQGQTFERVGIILKSPVFCHGQLYVAFSRARSLDAIKVVLPTGKKRTINVVYQEIFR